MCYWRWFDGRYVYVLLVISNDCICTNICGVDEIMYYPHSLLRPRRLFGRISRELYNSAEVRYRATDDII